MNKKKGYAPLRKTVTYMHRMINTGKWKAHSRIPTLARISEAVEVSVNTVRKAVAILEHERYLDNNGTLGYCVIPPDLTKLYASNKQLYFLRLLKMNLQSLEMINKGAKAVGKYIVLKNKETIEVTNILSGDMLVTSEAELRDCLGNPINLSSLIPLRGEALNKERIKYFRQQKLRDAARVILRHKEI